MALRILPLAISDWTEPGREGVISEEGGVTTAKGVRLDVSKLGHLQMGARSKSDLGLRNETRHCKGKGEVKAMKLLRNEAGQA